MLTDQDKQFFYIDRWVNKEFFRAFVYGNDNAQKLANSYNEFKQLIDSGLWFATKDEVAPMEPMEPNLKARKPKHGRTTHTDS